MWNASSAERKRSPSSHPADKPYLRFSCSDTGAADSDGDTNVRSRSGPPGGDNGAVGSAGGDDCGGWAFVVEQASPATARTASQRVRRRCMVELPFATAPRHS